LLKINTKFIFSEEVEERNIKYQNLDHSLMKRMKYSTKIMYKVIYIINVIYRWQKFNKQEFKIVKNLNV
jgi:hypothetical protein